jgi:tripeptide aminopeptidase
MIDQKLLSLFLEIIKIEGLSGSEKDIAIHISNFLKKLGLSPYEDDSLKMGKGNSGNIICKIGSGGEFVILSHMDTACSTKNVKPQVLNDRVTSDGKTVLGVDNRVGISCILYSIEKAIENKIPLKDFTVAFTTQEETTLHGSQNLNLNGSIKHGFIFDSQQRPGYFISESVGAIGFTIKVHGKASHSGLAPEKGIDSIKISSSAISQINFGKIDNETTANIGTIKGGSAINVVPELTVIEGEVRSIVPTKIDEKLEEIKTKFELTAEKFGGKVEFDFRWDFKPFRIAPDQDVYKHAVNVLQKVNLTPAPRISWGGSDANSLNAKGIPSINFGIGAANPHSNDEFILLEDLQKTADIILELIKI